MTLSDRRLLVELGAVLIIKLILIALIKIHFFSQAPDQTASVPSRFFPEARVETSLDKELSMPDLSPATSGHQDKER
ncbi:hypothetical protein [Microbulbifer pacificus]|uniref:hypothetical protein n=1 Tax=Microbulbifer pacificus TaxID=407164 RepID=UPI000CF39043|nr:hypothetical protein [Microbulbifer pacificus]